MIIDLNEPEHTATKQFRQFKVTALFVDDTTEEKIYPDNSLRYESVTCRFMSSLDALNFFCYRDGWQEHLFKKVIIEDITPINQELEIQDNMVNLLEGEKMSLIKKPHEISQKHTIKALIYGQPKIGKTTLTLSAPSPLLVDFDGGVNRVADEHRCDTVEISGWQDMLDLLNEDLSAYETLIIDTAGKMLDFMSAFIMKNDSKLKTKNGSMTQAGYGVRKAMFQQFLTTISNMGKHIIFVAHEKEEKKGDTTQKRPEIGGSSSYDLLKELDLIGYMQAIGENRILTFNPTDEIYAGNTLKLPAVIEVPNCERSQNIFFAQIVAKNQKMNEERNERLKIYQQKLDTLKGLIDIITDAEMANDFVNGMHAFEHIYDSKIKAGIMMRDKAKELGLNFNKESGKYE